MHNEFVTNLNDLILNALSNVVHELNFVDNIEKKNEHTNQIPDEFLRTLNSTSLFSFKLRLKIETSIMILRNLQSKQKFCNDSRCVIIRVLRNVLKVKIFKNNFND